MGAHSIYTYSSRYGLTGPIVSGGTASPHWVWSDGSGTPNNLIHLPPDVATYNTMDALGPLSILMAQSGTGTYSLHRVSNLSTGAGTGLWEGDGTWNGTTYYRATLDTTHNRAITQGIWYYAPYYDLGTVKNVSIDTESPHDVIGIPGQNETGTLVFDTEGVVVNINVDGAFFETTAQTMSDKISAIKNLITGNQYVGNPCAFWWDRELLGTVAKPYFVSVKKFQYQGTEKDVARVNYKLQLVVRALAV